MTPKIQRSWMCRLGLESCTFLTAFSPRAYLRRRGQVYRIVETNFFVNISSRLLIVSLVTVMHISGLIFSVDKTKMALLLPSEYSFTYICRVAGRSKSWISSSKARDDKLSANFPPFLSRQLALPSFGYPPYALHLSVSLCSSVVEVAWKRRP